MKKFAFAAFLIVIGGCHASAQIRETKLLPSDGGGSDFFGWSVSISGDYALIGAYGDDDNGSESGSAYVFHYDGSSWKEQAKLLPSDGIITDLFGISVSISGDYALIGAQGVRDNGPYSGSAYIFHYDGSNWVEQAELLPSDGDDYDYFGGQVLISGDYALIGATGDDDNGDYSGSTYIFHYDGLNWVEQSKLLPSDGVEDDYFGWSVSISGEYALISSPFDDDNAFGSGSSYLFQYDGSNWVEQGKLFASDGDGGDNFGKSVSLSGDYALVGATGDDDSGHDSGSAYIFYYDGSNWVQQAKLLPGDGAADDYFGDWVSFSGDYALIGTRGDDDNGYDSGSAYIFHYDGSNWVEQIKLLPSDAARNDWFGRSVSLSGDYALIGAFSDDDNGYNSGCAYVYSGFTSPVSVDLTISPKSGDGTFEYTIDLTNTTDTSQAVDLWTELVDPHGSSKEEKVMTGRILRGHRSYTKLGTSTLKESAPNGDYEFVVNAGTYPDSIIASASVIYTLASLRKEGALIAGATPDAFRLLQNYPDPFNPSTTIRYDLSQGSEVTIKVYNMLGQLVTTLVDDLQSAGQKSVVWNGTNDVGAGVSSGIYILRMTAGGFVETKRMLLIK